MGGGADGVGDAPSDGVAQRVDNRPATPPEVRRTGRHRRVGMRAAPPRRAVILRASRVLGNGDGSAGRDVARIPWRLSTQYSVANCVARRRSHDTIREPWVYPPCPGVCTQRPWSTKRRSKWFSGSGGGLSPPATSARTSCLPTGAASLPPNVTLHGSVTCGPNCCAPTASSCALSSSWSRWR